MPHRQVLAIAGRCPIVLLLVAVTWAPASCQDGVGKPSSTAADEPAEQPGRKDASTQGSSAEEGPVQDKPSESEGHPLAQESSPAEGSTQPSGVPETVEQRDAEAIESLLSTARAVAQGENREAWARLQRTLVDAASVKVLMHPSEAARNKEGAPLEDTYPDLSSMVRIVAEGNKRYAEQTFRVLCEDPLYQYSLYDMGKCRSLILFGAIRHIRSPTGEFVSFLEARLADKSLDSSLKMKIIEALASYGTSEAAAIIETHVANRYLLAFARYRDRSENTRILLDRYRKAGRDFDYARKLLGYVLDDSIPGAGQRFREPLILPRIDPQDKQERAKFVSLLEDFMAQPGSRPLTEEEKRRVTSLIERLKKEQQPTNAKEL